MTPSTHGIAYTLRGLLEGHALTGEPRWLQAVERTSEVLIRKLEVMPRLVADWDADWKPRPRTRASRAPCSSAAYGCACSRPRATRAGSMPA